MRAPIARVLVGAAIACAACADESVPARDSARYDNATGALEPERTKWIVSPTGIGPLRVGMTAADIRRALGDSALVVPHEACAYLHPARLPHGTSLMMAGGRLVRVDVDSGGVLMDTGLQVGDSEIAVMVMYAGRLRVESDKYRPAPAHVLTVSLPNDSANAVVFTTDGASVTSYRVGRRSAVELVERCG